MTAPKRLAIDFDGTLCEDRFPDIGPMKVGAREALQTFRDLGYYIIIWSCRSCSWDHELYPGDPNEPTLDRQRVKEMIAWLDANKIPYDEVDDGSRGKPSANYFIDDRAITFRDNWNEIASVIYHRTVGLDGAQAEAQREARQYEDIQNQESGDGQRIR